MARKEAKEIFPELKEESKDEKISAMLIRHIRQERGSLSNDEAAEAIDWLEKQGKKQPFDYENVNIQPKDFATKVEPKFKVGDWVVHDMSDGRKAIGQIVNITNKSYVLDGEGFNTFYFNDLENDYHLWTIQDAKDGDVLATDSWLYIFKDTNNKAIIQFHCTCPINRKPYKWCFSSNDSYLDIYVDANIHPATKEQRDLLLQKMHEAGYTFDFEKKELMKIVVPIFNIGDTIIEKDLDECGYGTIKDIKDGQYIFTDGYGINIDEQYGWQLIKTPTNIERNSAEWSEEDKKALIEKAVEFIANNMRCDGYTLQTKAKFIKDFKNYMIC